MAENTLETDGQRAPQEADRARKGGAKQDLTWLYDRLGLPTAGRRLVEYIRSSPPGRAAEGGRHNVHGFYPSRKMGCTIQFESNSCELAYVVQTEFDEKIIARYCQPPHPLKHVYRSENGKNGAHNHFEDFLEITEEAISFVQCKKEAELIELASKTPDRYFRDESGKWRCPSGEAAAARFGLRFKVVSSGDFNPHLLQNLDFLAEYLDQRIAPLPAAIDAITAFFSERSYGNLIDLIEYVGSADQVYRAIVTGHAYFELEAEFLSRTHSALVFRDCVSARAHRCVIRHRYFDPSPQVETVVLKTGNAIMWDGVPWTVLNVGATTITLSHDRDVAPLPTPDFLELLKKGLIKGATIERDPRLEAAKERLRTASPLEMEEAWRRYSIIAPRLTDGAAEAGLGAAQAPARTVRRYLELWKDGERLYLDGFIGLIPNFGRRGNHTAKLAERTRTLAKRVIRKHWLEKKAPTKQYVWARFKKISRRLGVPICSDKTFYPLFKEVGLEDAAEARHGHKAAYQVAGPLWDGDPEIFARHGDRVFAVAHIDHTEVDVEFVSSVTRVNLGKAWLTLLIDAHTRVILACVLSFDRPSYVSCMSAMRVCVARHGRLPDVIVCDQGKEFRSRCFRRFIAHHRRTLKFRPKSEPRFGAIIERAFGSLNTRLFHNLEGNTQNSKKPRESAKSHAPRERAVWSLPQFVPHLERFVYDVLPTLDHFGLLRTPKSLFDESMSLHGLREGRHIAYSEAFIVGSLPTPVREELKVHGRKGITVNYLTYWSRELRDPKVINTKVPVKFDPFDAGYILAWAKGQWVRCECTSTLFRGISIGEVMWAVAQIKEDTRRTHRKYRINTQALEDFFFTLMREEKALIAEKKRMQQQDRIPLPKNKGADKARDSTEPLKPSTDYHVEPTRQHRRPLKTTRVKVEVTT